MQTTLPHELLGVCQGSINNQLGGIITIGIICAVVGLLFGILIAGGHRVTWHLWRPAFHRDTTLERARARWLRELHQRAANLMAVGLDDQQAVEAARRMMTQEGKEYLKQLEAPLTTP